MTTGEFDAVQPDKSAGEILRDKANGAIFSHGLDVPMDPGTAYMIKVQAEDRVEANKERGKLQRRLGSIDKRLEDQTLVLEEIRDELKKSNGNGPKTPKERVREHLPTATLVTVVTALVTAANQLGGF